MRLKFFFLSETDIPYLSQVRFEQFTTITLSKSSNCFFLMEDAKDTPPFPASEYKNVTRYTV